MVIVSVSRNRSNVGLTDRAVHGKLPYLDQLERGADGRWRFRERVAEIESMRADLPPFVEGRPGRG
jgi:hypothetical protein